MAHYDGLLAQKILMESNGAWLRTPKAFKEYYAVLVEFSRLNVGVFTAFAPDCPFPVYIRSGTSDIRNFGQIFLRREYGFPVDEAPRRILDIGAYVGFAAVFLANRFPESKIFCIEPSDSNFFMLSLNTAPYKNIEIVNAAIWSKDVELALKSHVSGDWGAMFGEAESGGMTQGISIGSVMERLNWSEIDFLKCDCEGAEVEIFSDRAVSWRDHIGVSTVETHDRMIEGSSKTVREFFSEESFVEEKTGEFLLFRNKKTSKNQSDPETTARRVPLFDTTSPLKRVNTKHVSNEHWGLYFFDQYSFQLHPNKPGQPECSLSTAAVYDIGSVLRFGVAVAHEKANNVVFSVSIMPPDGEEVSLFSKEIEPSQISHEEILLPNEFAGQQCQFVFRTKMANGAVHRHALAQWHVPSIERSPI